MTDDEFQNRLLSLPARSCVVAFDLAVFDLMKLGTREQRKELLEKLRKVPQSERPTPEKRISRALSEALGKIAEGKEFLEARELRVALAGLEFFLPRILADAFPYWKFESLDGFYLSEARKIGPGKAEMRGICILISDQTITPFHVQTQIAPAGDEISWLACKLGRPGDGQGDMERIPWSRFRANSNLYLLNSLKQVDWTYEVTFGKESHTT